MVGFLHRPTVLLHKNFWTLYIHQWLANHKEPWFHLNILDGLRLNKSNQTCQVWTHREKISIGRAKRSKHCIFSATLNSTSSKFTFAFHHRSQILLQFILVHCIFYWIHTICNLDKWYKAELSKVKVNAFHTFYSAQLFAE